MLTYDSLVSTVVELTGGILETPDKPLGPDEQLDVFPNMDSKIVLIYGGSKLRKPLDVGAIRHANVTYATWVEIYNRGDDVAVVRPPEVFVHLPLQWQYTRSRIPVVLRTPVLALDAYLETEGIPGTIHRHPIHFFEIQ